MNLQVIQFLLERNQNRDRIGGGLFPKALIPMLIAATILAGSSQYFGNPISCEIDGIPQELARDSCRMKGLWTIKELHDPKMAHRVREIIQKMRNTLKLKALLKIKKSYARWRHRHFEETPCGAI